MATSYKKTDKKTGSDSASKERVLQFHTTIFMAGKTATGIEVPPEIVTALGSGKRPAVKVTINGFTYRSTIAVYGDVFMIGISTAVREQAGVKGGDEIAVTVELDDQPREVVIPSDFSQVLDKNPAAKIFFDSLSYSNKQNHILSIEQAKTNETRQLRIGKAIDMLNSGKK